MNFRRVLVAVHRDLGFFLAGLTIVYAISGVAVNHVSDWNPNYAITRETVPVGPLASLDPPAVARTVLERLQIADQPTAVIPAGPNRVRVFLPNRTIVVDTSTQLATDERVSKRPLLFQLNYLHLNHGKGVWTWAADIYAAGLLVLALTGIVIVKGRRGLAGRGLLWLLAGIVPPIAFLLFKG